MSNQAFAQSPTAEPALTPLGLAVRLALSASSQAGARPADHHCTAGRGQQPVSVGAPERTTSPATPGSAPALWPAAAGSTKASRPISPTATRSPPRSQRPSVCCAWWIAPRIAGREPWCALIFAAGWRGQARSRLDDDVNALRSDFDHSNQQRQISPRAGPSHPGSRCAARQGACGRGPRPSGSLASRQSMLSIETWRGPWSVGTLRCGSGPAEGQPSAAHPRNLARCPDRRERKRRDGRANPGIRPGIALVGWPTLPHHRGHEAATDRRPGQRHAQSSARKGRHQPQCPALIPFVPCTADAVAVPARPRLRGAAQPSKMRLSLA